MPSVSFSDTFTETSLSPTDWPSCSAENGTILVGGGQLKLTGPLAGATGKFPEVRSRTLVDLTLPFTITVKFQFASKGVDGTGIRFSATDGDTPKLWQDGRGMILTLGTQTQRYDANTDAHTLVFSRDFFGTYSARLDDNTPLTSSQSTLSGDPIFRFGNDCCPGNGWNDLIITKVEATGTLTASAAGVRVRVEADAEAEAKIGLPQ